MADGLSHHPEVADLAPPQTRLTNPDVPAPATKPTGMLPVRDIDQNFLAKNPYIQYAIACMRPNVVNSTAYSLALIRGARIHYTASDRDREITMAMPLMPSKIRLFCSSIMTVRLNRKGERKGE